MSKWNNALMDFLLFNLNASILRNMSNGNVNFKEMCPNGTIPIWIKSY